MRSGGATIVTQVVYQFGAYRIKPEYERQLLERSSLFREMTKTNKTLVHTFITTYGVANVKSHSIVHSEATMDDLFNS